MSPAQSNVGLVEVHGDTDAALDFIPMYAALTRLTRITLVSIDPVKSGTDGHTFAITDPAGMKQWIDARQGRRNIYFCPNEVREGIHKKPTKSDMETAYAVFVDCDPRKDEEQKPGGFEAERVRLKKMIAIDMDMMGDPPPNFVIDSGGGCQAFWVFEEPIPADEAGTQQAQSIGKALALKFGGDAVQNIDRVMRLPGTINIPTPEKQRRGRRAALATFVDLSVERCSLEALWRCAGGKVGALIKATSSKRLPIGDPSLMARDLEMLGRAVDKMPNDLDYYHWIAALAAMKAACGDDPDFFFDHVLPWCDKYGGDNTPDFVQAKWASIHDAELGADYIYGLARDVTKDLPYDERFDECEDFDKIPPDPSDLGRSTTLKSDDFPDFLPLPVDFDETKLPVFEWVLGNTALKGTVTAIYGPTSAGKSTFALLRAISIASGRPLAGEPVRERGRVVLYNAEDSRTVIFKRIGALLKYFDIPLEEVRDHLFIASGQDIRLVVANKKRDSVNRTPAVDKLIQFLVEIGAMHLCVDPMVSLHSGLSENSNDEMEGLLSALRRIASRANCSVDVVHHTSKHSSDKAGDINAARGASSIIAAVRCGLMVLPMKPDALKERGLSGQICTVQMAKANYARLDETERLFRQISVCINNGPGADSEFLSEGQPLLLQGDRIGILEFIQPNEVSAGRDAAKHDAQSKVLEAVIAAMGQNRVLPQSKILESLGTALNLGRTKIYEELNATLPRGIAHIVSIDGVQWQVTRAAPVGEGKASPVITLSPL